MFFNISKKIINDDIISVSGDFRKKDTEKIDNNKW